MKLIVSGIFLLLCGYIGVEIFPMIAGIWFGVLALGCIAGFVGMYTKE